MDAQIIRNDSHSFGRIYEVTKDNKVSFLPSVTTILKMKPDSFLEELKLKLGDEKYEHITRRAADRGTVMHKWLEIFLEHYGDNRNPEDALLHTQERILNEEFKLATEKKRALTIGRSLFYNMYNSGFYNNIKKVLHNEIFMYTFFKGGWAGTADFIYRDNNDLLVIQDFKSSSILKDPDNISKYKMQIAAYMFEYADMFGEVPDRGEIIISNEENDTVQTVIVPQDEFKTYLREFLGLMDEFRKTSEWVEFEQSIKSVV